MICCAVIGFFLVGLVPISFNFSGEMAYPESEATSSALLQSCGDPECVNFGTESILNEVISLEEARPWFLIWSMGNTQARFQVDASHSLIGRELRINLKTKIR